MTWMAPPARSLGSRLAPLTDTVPKALCPVGNRPLLDWALGRLAAAGFAGPDTVAVNVHHHRDAMLAELATYTDPPQVSLEAVPLGTAGALGALRDWIDGRDTLVVNADAFFSPDAAVVRTLLSGWAGERPRLLCARAEAGERTDFEDLRYTGACLLPWADVANLEPVPAGLYEVMWRQARAEDRLDLAEFPGIAIDCGTPGDYLRANLLTSGGAPVTVAGN